MTRDEILCMAREAGWGPFTAEPHALLINELLDSNVPKTEREHAAAREIESLRTALVTPPRREWVELTEEVISQVCGFGEYTTASTRQMLSAVARAIEAALKEKNT
jgi:hypothetical protein